MSAGFVLPLALRGHATSTPDRAAIIEPGRTWSYAELEAASDALAGRLLTAGVRPGDRVALLAGPSATALALIVAAGRIGACAAPLGTRLAGPELAAACLEIGPRLLVHDDERSGLARRSGVQTARLEDPSMPGRGAPASAAPLDPGAPAVAVATSGTTGTPKAVLLSHAAMASSAAAWSAALPESTGWLLCLGLSHVAGLGVAWRAFGAGVPLEIAPAFDPAAVLEALERGPASHVSLVPTQLTRLLDANDAGYWTLAGLRAVLLGGAPIPPALVVRALASGWPVVPTYGLTEAGSGVTALSTAEAAENPGSAGRPLPGVQVRIADPGPDGIGEIRVRTPGAFTGYLGRRAATAAAYDADGWLRTGDAGRLDAEGYLHVLDRRDDLLVSGGENVFPAEVESVIEEHPAIAQAGVAGRPDPTWGAVPVAAVVLRPGAPQPTSAELRTFCLARLAPYKVPVAFVIMATIPRTPSGKLRRDGLREVLRGAPRAAGTGAPE